MFSSPVSCSASASSCARCSPGWNYHLPYPIETALTPQALRVNKIDIGFNLRRGSTLRDVPEEALMLTGDENIVGVDFAVLWKVKPNHVGDYLFNVQDPEATVKAVGESAMRAVIGQGHRIASTGEKTSGCRDSKSRPRCMDCNHQTTLRAGQTYL